MADKQGANKQGANKQGADKQAAGEQAADEEAGGTKSGKLRLVLGIVGVLLLGGGGAGVAYYLGTQRSAPEPRAAAPEATLPKEAVYVALDPPFTVNFQEDGQARFLQVSLEAMTRDQKVAQLIAKHMPAIRNNLVLTFSAQTATALVSKEGKESLREETRAAIQSVIEGEAGEGQVEAVYFTSFVMQ